MKTLLCYLALAGLSAGLLTAFPPPGGGSARPGRRSNLTPPAPPASGDACSSCTNETFEGTGYAVAGWTESLGGGIVNEDYTTAPAPILGSQSLLAKNVAFASSFTEINLPNSTEGWMRFALVLTNTAVTGWYVATFADSGGAAMARLSVQGAKLRVECGAAITADTATSIVANKTNYIWFHYKKGTGVNAQADVGFAEHPTKTRPTGGGTYAQTLLGTSTVNCQLFRLGGGDDDFVGAEAGGIYDNASLTTIGVIGDFP